MIWFKTLLGNKYTWVFIIIALIVAYYNIRILSLNSNINDKTSEYNILYKTHTELNSRYDKLVIDLNQSLETNKRNIETLKTIKINFDEMLNIKNLQGTAKDNEIKILMNTIKDLKSLPNPDYANSDTIEVNECIVKITSGGGEYEKQKLIDISNIGN